MKARNKKTGEIVEYYVCKDVYNGDILDKTNCILYSQKSFNELYEVIPETSKCNHLDDVICTKCGQNDWNEILNDLERKALYPNHPYGGMEVLDNVPKETWEDRFDVKFGDLEHMENGKVAYFHYDSTFQKVKDFFQQELDRISKNFMTEFVDPDTNLLNISKYDHERIISFFNREINDKTT